MDCREARRLLSAMVDEQLEPGRIGPLEEHLAGCAGCRKTARVLEAVRAWFGEQPRPNAPAGFTERVRARIREPGARLIAFRPVLRIASAAAALLLLLTTAAIALLPPIPVRPGAEVATKLTADGALDLILTEIARENAPLAASEEDR